VAEVPGRAAIGAANGAVIGAATEPATAAAAEALIEAATATHRPSSRVQRSASSSVRGWNATHANQWAITAGSGRPSPSKASAVRWPAS
jgi:hypothetical protein